MAVVVAGTIQGKAGKPGKAGKAGKTGPGQTKPRLGTTGKPAKQFRAEKHCENSKNGMNQVQVPPFELKLRQNGATPPRLSLIHI